MVGAQVAMKLAFWKRKRSRRNSPKAAADADTELQSDTLAEEADAAQLVRVRTRRRLIGAFALLLAVVVLVPMLLDTTPRTVSDNIPIELPSDKAPFAPRIPAPAPENSNATQGTAVVPAAPGSAADTATEAPSTGVSASKPNELPSAPSKKSASPTGEAAKGESKHTAHKADGASSAAAKIFVQAAAMANESAAQELANRLTKSGLSPFVQRTETSDGVRFRVRLGPFASRGDAERSRARLRAMGVHSNIVGA